MVATQESLKHHPHTCLSAAGAGDPPDYGLVLLELIQTIARITNQIIPIEVAGLARLSVRRRRTLDWAGCHLWVTPRTIFAMRVVDTDLDIRHQLTAYANRLAALHSEHSRTRGPTLRILIDWGQQTLRLVPFPYRR